jgi:hypothetical protein
MEMLASYQKQQIHDDKKDYRQEWRQAVALADLLRKIVHASKAAHFNELWPHILLLLGKTSFAQNFKSPISDADANKLFELYFALIASPLASQLDLDHPVHSAGGKNPDIIATISGVRWAFACKVMHSESYETFVNRVREGVDQIDRADADQGIVVVSLKNVIPHDDFWPITLEEETGDVIYQTWITPDVPLDRLLAISRRYQKEVIDELLGDSGFNSIFSEAKNVHAVPAVLLHLSTTVGLVVDNKPVHTLLRTFCVLHTGALPPDAQSLLDQLNESLHDQFSFQNP